MNINNHFFNPTAIIISIFFGIIIGVLFVFGQIPFIITGVWIEFGLAVIALIILISSLFTVPHNKNGLPFCFQKSISFLLSGISGTIITAIVALSTDLNPSSIFDIIIVSIVSVFFAYTLYHLVFLIICIKTALYMKSVR